MQTRGTGHLHDDPDFDGTLMMTEELQGIISAHAGLCALAAALQPAVPVPGGQRQHIRSGSAGRRRGAAGRETVSGTLRCLAKLWKVHLITNSRSKPSEQCREYGPLYSCYRSSSTPSSTLCTAARAPRCGWTLSPKVGHALRSNQHLPAALQLLCLALPGSNSPPVGLPTRQRLVT